MIKSMTGYGRGEAVQSGRTITVEVRSVNNRYLDCTVKLPRMYVFAEEALKAGVQARISRGKVDVFVTIGPSEGGDVTVSVNRPAAGAYYAALCDLKASYGLKDEPTLALLTRFPDIFLVEKTPEDLEALGAGLRSVLDLALDDFDAMRTREGEKLREDVLRRAGTIEALTGQVEERAPGIVAAYRARLEPERGPVHIAGMTTMAECRAAMLAVRQAGCGDPWVSWACDEDGESPTRVAMLAALFVCEGMGAAAFGVDCPEASAPERLAELAAYAQIPLFRVRKGEVLPCPYTPAVRDPDAIPCATGTGPCFIRRTIDVGEELECGPDLLEDIIAAEDDPVGAVKIAIQSQDDVEIFAQHQYAVRKALCLWSDVPELLEEALRVYQGRAFYDGTGEIGREELERLSELYGLIIL